MRMIKEKEKMMEKNDKKWKNYQVDKKVTE